MQLNEVGNTLSRSAARLVKQSDFVATIQERKDNGETKITVEVDGVFSEVSIDDFLATIKSTLTGYQAHHDSLRNLSDTLQEQLDSFVEHAGEYQDVPSQAVVGAFQKLRARM